MAYATVDELLDRMGHSGATNVALIARLSSALDAATTAIDMDTGRTFTAATATKEFGATHYRELRVPDLVSVTTLKVDDDDDGVFETTIAATDYELDTYSSVTGWPYEVVRLVDRDWPSGGRRRRRIEIVGSWGWSATPAPINQACTLLAGRIAQRSSTAIFGTQSFGDLGAAPIRTNDPDYMHLVRPYTKPQVA
jgi:hypothetical protein